MFKTIYEPLEYQTEFMKYSTKQPKILRKARHFSIEPFTSKGESRAHMYEKSYMSECIYILSSTPISRLIHRISD